MIDPRAIRALKASANNLQQAFVKETQPRQILKVFVGRARSRCSDRIRTAGGTLRQKWNDGTTSCLVSLLFTPNGGLFLQGVLFL